MSKSIVLVLAAFVAAAAATAGVDISSGTSSSSFSCLKSHGYDFVIVRGFESINQPDPACPGSVDAAWDAGLAHVDVYMFPDPHAGNPAGQVNSLLDYLSSHGIHKGSSGKGTYGMVWLDIEGPQYWSSSQGDNQGFFNGLVSELKAKGQDIGVYTSASQWEPIMGDWHGGAAFPLWYAHYDNNPSFSDFSAFAGWTKPAMKQYQGNVGLCSAGVDLNWYP